MSDMTPEEAMQLIEADKQTRLQAFGKVIEQAAQEFRCDLAGVPRYVPDGAGGWKTVVDMQIVAK